MVSWRHDVVKAEGANNQVPDIGDKRCYTEAMQCLGHPTDGTVTNGALRWSHRRSPMLTLLCNPRPRGLVLKFGFIYTPLPSQMRVAGVERSC